jgi:SAM-dependent methyltransferase
MLLAGQMQAEVDETVWKTLHSHYQKQEWIQRPSIFAETAVTFFPKKGTVLELGAGIGQDSIYFASLGYQVVSSDIEINSLSSNLCHQDETIVNNITIEKIDLSNRLPFKDNVFDVVYAHLSLHYFDKNTTQQIFDEIERVLKPGGIIAFLSNSINDPEYRTGVYLEDDFFLIGKAKKRYLSLESVREFTKQFHPLLLDDQGETYKDQAKGVKSLIRYIGQG